ncbi:MAG: transmembrane 220 family protein [Saprospiraceae bacterium]|nr:transmembrane 220 family protein [Saprospiraceae bacterium]
MKIANWVLAAMFALFAAVQYNDPDPWRWALMYGFVAFVCAFSAVGKRNLYVLWAGLGIGLGWAILLVPEFINWMKMGSPNIAGQMKAETPYIEFTREFLGLVLCLLALGWQVWLSKRKQ